MPTALNKFYTGIPFFMGHLYKKARSSYKGARDRLCIPGGTFDAPRIVLHFFRRADSQNAEPYGQYPSGRIGKL